MPTALRTEVPGDVTPTVCLGRIDLRRPLDCQITGGHDNRSMMRAAAIALAMGTVTEVMQRLRRFCPVADRSAETAAYQDFMCHPDTVRPAGQLVKP